MNAAKVLPIDKEIPDDNLSYGYIKLYRSISSHWLWEDEKKLKWWIDILLQVNHKDQRILIGGSLIECRRGQSVYSLQTWAKRWRTNISAVRRFLKLLENDAMIVTENVSKTTRITLCNYGTYNDERNDYETIMKRRRNDDEKLTTPNKNVKNDKNIERGDKSPSKPKTFKTWTEKEFIDDIANFKDQYPKDLLNTFYKHWSEAGPTGRMKFQMETTWETKKRLSKWADNEAKWSKK